MVLTTILFIGCRKDKVNIVKIPYLPITKSNVLYIGLYGYSQEGRHSNNREATEEEMVQIINCLNNIGKYGSKVKIREYKNGRPEASNIQVFTKDNARNENKNFMYVLEKDEGYIMISRPQSGIGYIVKQPELNKILRELRQ